MTKALWLVRHGLRYDFENPGWRDVSPRPDDPPLSSAGKRQAEETGEFLKGRGIEVVYSSPFLRTLQTSQIIAERIDARVRPEDGFSEWLNPEWFRGRPELLDPRTRAARFSRVDAGYRSQGRALFPEPDENVQMFARLRRTLDVILPEHDGEVLVVCHGAVVHLAERCLVGSERRLSDRTCAVNRIVRRGDRWHVALVASDHLSVGEERTRLH